MTSWKPPDLMTWVHSAGMAKLARLKGLHGPGQSVEADNEVPPLVNQMGGFHSQEVPPELDELFRGKSQPKMDDLGYLHFRKPPNGQTRAAS